MASKRFGNVGRGLKQLAYGFAIGMGVGFLLSSPAAANDAWTPTGLAGFQAFSPVDASLITADVPAVSWAPAPGISATPSGSVDWAHSAQVRDAAKRVEVREGAARGFAEAPGFSVPTNRFKPSAGRGLSRD